MIEFSIMTISAFVAALNECVKLIGKTFGWNVKRYIPIFSLVFGALLGLWGYSIDRVDMGGNIVEALFIGLSAGGAATGCHQIFKQLSKDDDDEEIEPAKPPSVDLEEDAEESDDSDDDGTNEV